MTPKIVVDATSEPITLAEARLQCKVDQTDDDDLIEALITAARQHCENFLGMTLTPKTLEIALNEWPDDGIVELPMGPVSSIVSVTVGTGSDALLDPADYVLDDFSVPNRLVPETDWTAVTSSTNAIRIIYTAGFDGPTSSDGPTLPKTIVQAMKLLVADWYKHREDTDAGDVKIPNGVESLLRPHRIRLGMA